MKKAGVVWCAVLVCGMLSASAVAMAADYDSSYHDALANIVKAIAEKTAMLETINATLEEEQTAYDALGEMLASGDYGGLTKGDIIKAQQKIFSAMQHEIQAATALDKAIEKLRDSLASLGIPEPVAWWMLDEGEGNIAYDWVGGYDGTIYGNPTWTQGLAGTALDFDGNADYVRTSYEGGPREYTVSLWYYLNEDIDPATFDGYMALVSKTGDEESLVELWNIWFATDRGLALSQEKSRSNYATVSWKPDGDIFRKDEWHHVAATGTATEGRIYFDGELKGTLNDNFAVGAWDDSVPFDIGRPHLGVPDRFFNGGIDEIMLFDRVLSDEEIRQLYNTGVMGH